MGDLFGIMLIDGMQVTLRIYKITEKKWRLLHYDHHALRESTPEKTITAYSIAEAIVELLSSSYVEEVVEWKLCARNLRKEMVMEIALASGIKIEFLALEREQELIAKGLFTEFW